MRSGSKEAAERYRGKIAGEAWIRCAARVRRVVAALSGPERRAAVHDWLRKCFRQTPNPSLKRLLASAPLEGIDIERPHDSGREVKL